MKKNFKFQYRGFTLIELIIITAVISLLTGGGVASYVKFNQKETLKKAGLQVKTYLREAQTKALAGEKDSAICGEQTLDGWCVDLSRRFEDKNYLYGHCGGPDSTGNFKIKELQLPANVSLSFSPPEGAILRFMPLAQGVDKSSIICLSLSGFSKFYKLEVKTSGEIIDYELVDTCP